MAEQLKIEIDVSAAKASLEGLGTAFKSFAATATASVNTASSAVGRLNAAMSQLKAIDAGILTSLQAFNAAISNLNSGAITSAAQALSSMSGVASGVQTTANATQVLAESLARIRAPDGVERISVSFGRAGQAAQQADAHIRAFAQTQRAVAANINQLGRELINAAGFMTGLGVTAGNIVQSLSQLARAGMTVGGVFAGLQTQFGTFGAVSAVLAGVAVAFNSLLTAARAILGPILEVGKAFNTFKLAVDAVDGSGAGAKTFEQIKNVARETGQNVLGLVKSFTAFRTATEAAGISGQKSVEIFRQFSGAFRAMGVDSVRAEKGMLAITQMFSKGKVQAEELRGQLGDALPGAFVFAAKAMGITTAALDGMLKSGQVLASDLVPALGKFLEVKFADAIREQVLSATGQLELFGNAITNLQAKLADGGLGGVMGGIAAGFAVLNQALDSAAISGFAAAIGDLLGILSSAALGVLGGFIEGLTAVMNTVIAIGRAFAEFTGIGSEFFASLSEGNSVMESVATVFRALGVVLGALAAQYAATKLAALAYSAVNKLLIGETSVLATVMRTASAAVSGQAAATAGAATSAASATAATGAWAAVTATATAASTQLRNAIVSLHGLLASSAVASYVSALRGMTAAQAASTIAATAQSAAIGVMSTVARGAAAAFAFLGTGIRALTALISANPLGALITGLTVVAPLVYSVVDSFNLFSSSTGKAKQEAEGLSSTTETLSGVLKTFSGTMAQTPREILNAATAFETFESAQKRAEAAVSALELQLKRNQSSLRDHDATVRDLQRGQQDFVGSLNSQIQALENNKTAIERANRAYSDMGSSAEGVDPRIRRINDSIKDLKSTIEDSNSNIQDRLRREAEWKDSVKATDEQIREQIRTLKEWGVALNEPAQAIAENLVAMGESKKSAADLAYQIQLLTRTEQERVDAVAQEVQQGKEKIAFLTEQSQKIREALAIEEERLRQSGETEASIRKQTEAYRETINNLDGLAAKTLSTVAAQEAYKIALEQNIPLTDAAKIAAQQLGEQFGAVVDSNKAMAGAVEEVGKQMGVAKTASEGAASGANKLATASANSSDNIDDAGASAKVAAEKIDMVKASLDNASGTLSTAASSIAGMATGFSTAAAQAQSLALALPPIQAALDVISQASLPALIPQLVPFNEGLTKAAESFAILAQTTPPVSEGFAKIAESVVIAAPPANILIEALSRIPAMADGITAAQVAMQDLLQALIDAQPQIMTSAELMDRLGATGLAVGQGFNSGAEGAAAFTSKLDEVLSRLDEVIQKMLDLKTAAEEALSAAEAAASAGGSGGGTEGQRLGGYSEENIQKSSSLIGSELMKTAPQFRFGTANTSSHISKLAGGGIPSILHPNEAVVPLPRGRKIPVDLNLESLPSPEPIDTGIDRTMMDGTASALLNIGDQLSKLADVIKVAPTPPELTQPVFTPTINVEVPEVPSVEFLDGPIRSVRAASSYDGLTSPNLPEGATASDRRGGDSAVASQTVNVTINVSTEDVDGFRRSEDQIARRLSEKIRRANRRNG